MPNSSRAQRDRARRSSLGRRAGQRRLARRPRARRAGAGRRRACRRRGRGGPASPRPGSRRPARPRPAPRAPASGMPSIVGAEEQRVERMDERPALSSCAGPAHVVRDAERRSRGVAAAPPRDRHPRLQSVTSLPADGRSASARGQVVPLLRPKSRDHPDHQASTARPSSARASSRDSAAPEATPFGTTASFLCGNPAHARSATEISSETHTTRVRRARSSSGSRAASRARRRRRSDGHARAGDAAQAGEQRAPHAAAPQVRVDERGARTMRERPGQLARREAVPTASIVTFTSRSRASSQLAGRPRVTTRCGT